MNETVPSVTVLIAARPGQAEVKAVAASRALDYPADRLEIIVARGKQPSVQRNAALRAAHGELIYFLDDDSAPEPGNLRRAVAHFRDPKVQMVGGPNLCPPDAPPLEQVFALVLASWLAFGPSRARYAAGRAGARDEREGADPVQPAGAPPGDARNWAGSTRRFIRTRRMRSWTSCRSAAAS